MLISQLSLLSKKCYVACPSIILSLYLLYIYLYLLLTIQLSMQSDVYGIHIEPFINLCTRFFYGAAAAQWQRAGLQINMNVIEPACGACFINFHLFSTFIQWLSSTIQSKTPFIHFARSISNNDEFLHQLVYNPPSTKPNFSHRSTLFLSFIRTFAQPINPVH